MRIARLELFGFKSFPDRTVFEFGKGVSCVVGPNGSGKSNVVDAMRWCIGEQSARSLRGSEMLDVIFAGSADRAPVGFAEVRFLLSADTGEPFPGEYAPMSELQVGRRLHRNGTSEYSINGVKCRRRDIVELFLDTGVGNNLYSFIAQGQVERIVHAQAMDRRALIDEAAGISRYATRRAEAQQRLEATGAQLDRAADVADEMERRLNTLERQVFKAARFRRLRALVKQEQTYLALVQYREMAADRRALREDLRKRQNEAATNRRELMRRSNDLTQRREEIAVVDAAAAQWRDEVAELDARRRELEGARGFQSQRAAELIEQADRFKSDAEQAEAIASHEQAEVEKYEALALELQTQLDGGEGARLARRERVAEAARKRTVAVAERDRALADLGALRANRAAEQARIDGLARQMESLAERQSQAGATLDASKNAIVQRQHSQHTVEAAVREARKAVESASRAASEARDAAHGLRETEATAQQEVQRCDAAIDDARQALDALVEEAAVDAEEARRDASAALVSVEREREELARSGRDQVVRARQAARDQLERQVADLRLEVETALSALSTAVESVAIVDGNIGRLKGEIAGLDAAVGTVVDGLADGRPAVDRLALDSDEVAELAVRVGDRIWLPVASSAKELAAVLQQVGEGTARVVLARDGDPRAHWNQGWTRCEDLDEAVALHLKTGAGAVAPGVRVDPDGVVTLGAGASAEEVLAIHQRRVRAAEQLERAREERTKAENQLAAAESALVARCGQADPAECRAWVAAQRQLWLEGMADPECQTHPSIDRLREVAAAAQVALDEGLDAFDQRLRECRDRVEVAVVAVGTARDAARQKGAAAVDAARATRASAVASVEQARAQARQGATLAEQSSQAFASAELALTSAEGKLALATAAVAESEAMRDAVAGQLEDLAATQASLTAERESLVQTLGQRDATILVAEEALAEAVQALSVAEQAEQGVRAEVSAREAEAGAVEARRDGFQQSARDAKARASSARERVVRAQEAEQDHRARAEQAKRASAEAEQERLVVEESRARVWDKLQRERGRLGKLREGLLAAEEDGRALQEHANTLQIKVAELESRTSSVRTELEVLRRSMEDRYQISLSAMLDRLAVGEVTLAPDPEIANGFEVAGRKVDPVEPVTITRAMLEDSERVSEVVAANAEHRKALERLGEVNLGALEEYTDLTKRHGELVTQREDLEASVRDIRTAIAKMNRTCRQRFRDAFDRVNEAFQVTYPRLVGGGSARLSLTNEEDLLQTGVEIYVQPPGKRLQNLTLLSGGEKAMTAIALVIALFKVKPSPFCVLDEVDAPLDEANGHRFNEILREMSTVSQFVVVTHNRKTMEAADTLYGVTMASPGVSRLVSVNLDG